ncbi:MAG: ABC transporter permease [Phycisphaerales bacterium]|nr:MAG: ABC transporter permease [Phycisphaerales bacterium]
MRTLLQDIRYGSRMLVRNPGFTAVVVLVLGLGIGANTAIFNALDQVLFRALSVEKPDELVTLEYIWLDEDEGESGIGRTFSFPLYESYRDQSHVFAGLVAFDDKAMNLAVNGAVNRVRGMAVSSNYFLVLGIKPALGSLIFTEEDRSSTAEPVVAISHGLWRRRFGADQGIIGKQIAINDHPVTILGVAPRGFTGTLVGPVAEVYVPLRAWAAMTRRSLDNRAFADWYLLGRLKHGISREQAQAALRVLAAQIGEVEPNNTHTNVLVSDGSRGPMHSRTREASVPLLLFMVIVSLVLLIACANVANMQLARAVTRRKEIAIRQALGASRARIIRQLLAENMVLALFSGGCGVLLAVWLDRLLCIVMATINPISVTPGLNMRMFLFALAVSLITPIASGLAPALQTTKPDIIPTLKETARFIGRPRRWNAQSLVVVVQMALAITVLVCGGVCLHSLIRVRWVDPGFDPTRILVASVGSQRQHQGRIYPRHFFEDLQERVAELPGIESTSLAGDVPLGDGGVSMTGVRRMENREIKAGEEIILHWALVGPGYFRTLGLPLLMGCDISIRDVPEASRVMVVNEILAQRYWPGQDPIGKRVTFCAPEPGAEEVREVIGVVKAAKHYSIREEPTPIMYWPLVEASEVRPVLLIRATGDPRPLVPSIRNAATSLGMPASACDVRTIVERQWELFYPQRVLTGILNTFGLVVLVLSATGIYAVMAYAVRQRTRELGIRIAVGAQRRDVLTLVLLEGAALTTIGLGLGIGMSLIAMRFVESNLPAMRMWDRNFLYGVSLWDPLPYVCAALVLALVTFMACYIPARRATRIDPMTALRYE